MDINAKMTALGATLAVPPPIAAGQVLEVSHYDGSHCKVLRLVAQLVEPGQNRYKWVVFHNDFASVVEEANGIV